MKKKNLLIIGATGGTGLQLVEQALGQGHLVTAFVRDRRKIKIKHPNLELFEGDVFEFESLNQAVRGKDVVFSTLGAPPSNKKRVRSRGTKNIIRAMEANNVSRFICMTTLGIGDSKPMLPFLFKYFLVPFILKGVFADSEKQEKFIFESKLAWTVVRPGSLTNKERTGDYLHGFPNTKKIKTKISRADVADFMLKQLVDVTYLKKTPGLSY